MNFLSGLDDAAIFHLLSRESVERHLVILGVFHRKAVVKQTRVAERMRLHAAINRLFGEIQQLSRLSSLAPCLSKISRSKDVPLLMVTDYLMSAHEVAANSTISNNS